MAYKSGLKNFSLYDTFDTVNCIYAIKSHQSEGKRHVCIVSLLAGNNSAYLSFRICADLLLNVFDPKWLNAFSAHCCFIDSTYLSLAKEY